MDIKNIRQIIETAFAKDEDNHVENILDEALKQYEVKIKMAEQMEWSDEGKFQNGVGVAVIEIDGKKIYAEVSQCRSGDYYSEYYYSNVTLDSLKTEEEYNTPANLVTFDFRGHIVTIREDGRAVLDGSVFVTTEAAIDSLI